MALGEFSFLGPGEGGKECIEDTLLSLDGRRKPVGLPPNTSSALSAGGGVLGEAFGNSERKSSQSVMGGSESKFSFDLRVSSAIDLDFLLKEPCSIRTRGGEGW